LPHLIQVTSFSHSLKHVILTLTLFTPLPYPIIFYIFYAYFSLLDLFLFFLVLFSFFSYIQVLLFLVFSLVSKLLYQGLHVSFQLICFSFHSRAWHLPILHP